MWRSWLRVGLLGAVVACAGAPRVPAPPPPARDALALPRELEAPGATILLGDLHGTRELPGFVAELVSQLARARPVVLALEIPPSELPSVDARRAQRADDPARCLAELDRIAGDAATASDAYRQACCRARMGDKEAAFERLQVALDRGFHDLDAMAADADLAALHDDPRWPPRPAR